MSTPTVVQEIKPTRIERNVTATEAAEAARAASGGVEGTKRVRIGLGPRHPSFSAQYGPLTFHKITQRVSSDGLNRAQVMGQVLNVTEAQVTAALADARFKMVRVIAPGSRAERSSEFDVRYVSPGFITSADRPVLDYKGPANAPIDRSLINWENSLLYIHENPGVDIAPPESFEEAVKAHARLQDLESVAFGAPVPPPTEKGTTVDANVSEVMGKVKARGMKVTPTGEVKP